MLNALGTFIAKVIVAPLIFVLGVAGFTVTPTVPPPQEEVESNLGAFNPAGGLTYRLQASIGTTDTTLKLTSFKNRSAIKLTMTLLDTDIAYGTISPQTSRSEFVSFTGITQNADGTATLTGLTRGLSDISPFTASTTLRNAHPGQSVFILSDSPQLFAEYPVAQNSEYIHGLWSFGTIPYATTSATSTNQFATRAYADSLTITGAPTSTELVMGVSVLGTQKQMASSTASTTATAPLVIPAKWATSTPGANIVGSGGNGQHFVVISEGDGYINKDWIDPTEDLTLGDATTTTLYVSGHASSSVTTIGALGVGVSTTTQRNAQIAGDLQVSGSVSIGGSLSGGGTRLLGAAAGKSETGENSSSLLSVTVPANALGTANVIEITGTFIATTTDANARVSVGGTYGGQQLGTTTIFHPTTAVSKGIFTISLLADGATNDQQAMSMLSPASTTVEVAQIKDLSVDSTQAQTLTIYEARTGTNSTFNIRNILVKLWRQ